MTSVTAAWQAALQAEYAAEFGYDILGPHLTDSGQRATARAAQAAHRTLAEQASADLAAAHATPGAAQPAYPVPTTLGTAAAAARLALTLEESAAAAWRYALAAAAEPTAPAGRWRASAQAALTASAVRAVRWRRLVSPDGPTVPFPGL